LTEKPEINFENKIHNKGAYGMAQVVEHLVRKRKALSSNLSTITHTHTHTHTHKCLTKSYCEPKLRYKNKKITFLNSAKY
jgi:hypothetical protein